MWSTKVIDLKGSGKHSNVKKCIHLARCSQIEYDNYSSEKFFIKHSDGFTDDLIAESETERAEWITCISEICGIRKWTVFMYNYCMMWIVCLLYLTMHNHKIIIDCNDLNVFLNQLHAGLWLACDWFLEIAFVHNVCMLVCVCVCASAPEAINN